YLIDIVKKERYPEGTGLAGVRLLYARENATLAQDDVYIRKIIELPSSSFEVHDEDEPASDGRDADVRMIICMTREGSRRLQNAQYIQSDIGFKRVVGYYEFELACLDRLANTSVIFCRVFLNRQTAAAHARLFQEIDNIVKEDTGRSLKWRHIHGNTKDENEGMILQFAADQHLGQAKGLGLYLQGLARQREGKYDLHKPDILLNSLSPYDHLHCVFRLCTVHALRNIRDVRGISDEVRGLMRSLICMTHPNWDDTLSKICSIGGKAATDWVKNKVNSKFAFEGLCWERSFIPKDVWCAGESNSNLIESVHADVNREGINCSLLAGIEKGRAFDAMKMKTLAALETTGIRPSYKPISLGENVTKNLKRKINSQHNRLSREDAKIEAHNVNVKKARTSLENATAKVQQISHQLSVVGPSDLQAQHRLTTALTKATKTQEQAQKKCDKEKANSLQLKGTGSGKVSLLES
ncbi:hypothetical protein H0H93_009227, partial [Arthromyces matolae]